MNHIILSSFVLLRASDTAAFASAVNSTLFYLEVNVTELFEYNVVPGSIAVSITGTAAATSAVADLATSGLIVVTYMGHNYYLVGFAPGPPASSSFTIMLNAIQFNLLVNFSVEIKLFHWAHHWNYCCRCRRRDRHHRSCCLSPSQGAEQDQRSIHQQQFLSRNRIPAGHVVCAQKQWSSGRDRIFNAPRQRNIARFYV